MSDPSLLANGVPSPHVEKLLDAANSASETVATLHVAFIAFAAYFGVIVWGTTHEDLLRISPVKLPILGVELPLTAFYQYVPWLLVLLHFNLLMQMELLSRKLWNLDRDLPDTPAGHQVRDRLFIFPFSHLIAGRSSVKLIRWLLSLTVGLTIIVLPLFMLLAAQIRFLPYHDEGITWSQRLAVWFDAVMLIALWPLIASPNDDWWKWWRDLRFQLFDYRFAWLLYWGTNEYNRLAMFIQRRWPSLHWREIGLSPMPQTVAESKRLFLLLTSTSVVVLLSIVAVIPGSITVKTYYDFYDDGFSCSVIAPASYFEDWLIRHVFGVWLSVVDEKENINTHSCTSVALTEKEHDTWRQVKLGPCSWLALGLFPHNLSLEEARLVPKELSLSQLTRALDRGKPVRDAAFMEFDGLKLQNRDLRFANLSEVILPKANLRKVRLQRADLSEAKLQGADLRGAQLQGANLKGAKLQGADLREAQLQGADLSDANLQDAFLSVANLQGTNLHGAELQGADLSKAKLQGTDLTGAKLQGADLANAELQGANLNYANFHGAKLDVAQLQGANMWNSQLQGANLSWSNMKGAVMISAELQGAVMKGAELQGADMKGAKLQGADLSKAKLQGTDLTGAQLQGTVLTEAQLQGAIMKEAELQGVDWSQANMDGLFTFESLMSDLSESQQDELEATLKPLLGEISFTIFHKRLEFARNGWQPGKSTSQTGCYSDNPTLLECEYGQQQVQLDTYRTLVLHPMLVELACSDAAIAKGIVTRVYNYSEITNIDEPDFGLAAALLKALDNPKPCMGLTVLSEETHQYLRKTAEKQEKKANPK